jgi:hypothetical protein
MANYFSLTLFLYLYQQGACEGFAIQAGTRVVFNGPSTNVYLGNKYTYLYDIWMYMFIYKCKRTSVLIYIHIYMNINICK